MNRIIINLKNNIGYKWYSDKDIYVKGYFFDDKNEYYENEKLINFFINVKNKNDFYKQISKINGSFSVIIKKNNFVFAAVDRIRTFPLFYYIKNGKISITDDSFYLKDKFNLTTNKTSKDEYLYTGYVTGRETLLLNIFQIQAGEYIYFDNEVRVNNYFSYSTEKTNLEEVEDLKIKFSKILNRMIQRLIKSVDGKTIVVPLSSGYDSRLIVSLLKINNYKNVICYTYGNKDSIDVSISKKVAKALGFKWYFINSHIDSQNCNYINTLEFESYCKLSFNFSSTPHFQDYFIVKQLKFENIIPLDSVFVPGHSGDMLAGSRLYSFDKKKYNSNKLMKRIVRGHFILRNYKTNKKIEKKIIENIYLKNKLSHSLIHNFDLKERQSKFIVNSVRVYEFFGYKHKLPLWDLELIHFFKYLDLNLKLNSNFYRETLFDFYFKPLKIEFIPPDKIKNNNVKNFLRVHTPQIILNAFKNKYHKKNTPKYIHPYFKILEMMKDDKKKYLNENSIISDWSILKLINK